MINRIRLWLLTWLAGGKPLIMNCNINSAGVRDGWRLYANIRGDDKAILTPLIEMEAPPVTVEGNHFEGA